MKVKMGLNCNMHLALYDELGKLKDEVTLHNTATTGGKQGVSALIASGTLKPAWMAVGTGSPTGTGATDKLGTEVARVAVDSKTTTNAICTIVATFPAGTATGTLTEAGLFDVVTANTTVMWASGTFSQVKGAGDSLVITWTLTIS
jgi:hypothetical protein